MKKVVLVALLLIATPLFATNGYFSHGTGTLSKGMAGAGLGLPREALDHTTNPAAAAFIDRGYSAALSIFSPDRQYSIGGNPTGYPGTFGLTPGTVESKSEYFPMPSLAANYRPNETTGVGLSIVAHGGMNTDYRTNTFYGSDHTGVNLAQMFFTGTYAKKLSKNHGVGLSVVGVAQQFKASGLQAFSMMSHDAQSLSNNGSEMSYGAGLQLGYLGYLTDRMSIGASYMPQIKMSEFEKYSGLFADDGRFDIPASAGVGFAYRATDAVTLAVDYQRIHFSDVAAVGNHLMPNLMTAPLGLEGAAGFGWDDVNVVKLGASWQATPDWMFNAGYSKANQPIPESEVLFNILAPGVIEEHITFGFSRAISTGRFNVALMYAPTQTVKGVNPLEAPGAQTIELKMNEWEIEFGFNF